MVVENGMDQVLQEIIVEKIIKPIDEIVQDTEKIEDGSRQIDEQVEGGDVKEEQHKEEVKNIEKNVSEQCREVEEKAEEEVCTKEDCGRFEKGTRESISMVTSCEEDDDESIVAAYFRELEEESEPLTEIQKRAEAVLKVGTFPLFPAATREWSDDQIPLNCYLVVSGHRRAGRIGRHMENV